MLDQSEAHALIILPSLVPFLFQEISVSARLICGYTNVSHINNKLSMDRSVVFSAGMYTRRFNYFSTSFHDK